MFSPSFIFDIFENDQNIEDFYKYEIKEGEIKKNYVLGKYKKNYSFYFSKLLKAMADNGYFEILKKLLENNSDLEKMKTIFCILINGVNFLHKEYYKENYSNFEGCLLNIINHDGIETNLKKDDIENFIFILAKINFLINYKKQDFNIKMEINNLFLKLGLEMIKSQ